MTNSNRQFRRLASAAPAVTAALLSVSALIATAAPARALEVLADEKAGRKACEKSLCQIILEGKEAGPPLACNMVKTWDRTKIKKSGEKKALSWGFGDARCKVSLKIPRAQILPALVSDKHTFQFETQTVDCKIEDGERKLTTLEVDAAPKIKFKDGKAHKVWINIKDVRGDSGLKGLVWTVSKLADGIGIFHNDTLKAINTFIHETCEAEYGKGAKGKPGAEKAIRAEAR